jgi:hypothetical protein
MVTTRERAPRGGHSRLWGYGYADLAALLGYRSVAAVRNAVCRRLFDPGDLASVFNFKARRDARRKRA